MTAQHTNRRLGVVLMIISAISFGLMPSLASWSRDGHTGTETLLFIRFAISAILVGILAVALKKPFPQGRTLGKWILLAAVLYTGQSYSFFTALLFAPAALVSLLLYLYPVIVAGLSVMFLGEKLTPLRTGSLALAVLGAGLAVGPVAGAKPVGVAWGLAAAVCYSVYLVLGAGLLKSSNAIASSVVIMTSASVTYAFMATINGWAFPATTTGWLGAFGLALSSAVALSTLFAGMEIIGPIDASTLSAIEPIVTSALGFFVFGQILLPLQFVGGALILVAAVLITRGSKPALPEATETAHP